MAPSEHRIYFCARCGACCRWAGYVDVDAAEIERIAAYLRMDSRRFIKKYAREISGRAQLSLIEKRNSDCIFFGPPNICRIYPVRPKQCAVFPNAWAFPGFEQTCRAIKLRYRLRKLVKGEIADKSEAAKPKGEKSC